MPHYYYPSMPSLANRPIPDSNPAGQHTVATGNASGSEENERPAHDNFTIMLKWHFVLNLTVEGVQSVIHECHPDMVVDSDPWKEVLRKASHTMRSWKVASLKAMKAHIASQMLSSNSEDPESLVNLTDAKTLNFYRTFNEEAFYTCFRWTYEIIDLKNSPEVGRNYLRNIWANLAAHIKIWTDLTRDTGEGQSTAAEKMDEIHNVWYTLTKHDHLKGATKDLFAPRLPNVTSRKRRVDHEERTRPVVYYHGKSHREQVSDA
ncbi:uncharacterized protein N7515_007391 [Penicillium bovifimosum]|uniref:Uncharacterized protein n=1 Tax=Penicillium bovifimosum TaxID=126998 RepID=A0A9W9GWI2_9EURO|nr:uncharacterized protein N7515_007391 [Penicillium bovifimosum]KAJ5131352.1 hypothetical protein N7515_007391 [Penicillium bovifimosum]